MVSLADALARAQFAHAAADASPEQGTQGRAIGVAHLRGNLVDTRATGLQQMHRAFDAEILKIRQRGFAHYSAHASGERSLAGADIAGRTA